MTRKRRPSLTFPHGDAKNSLFLATTETSPLRGVSRALSRKMTTYAKDGIVPFRRVRYNAVRDN
jgi:hypothetical protein